MKYVRIIYNMLYNDCINFPNKVTWVTLHRDLLGNLGFMDVWLQQSIGDRVYFLTWLNNDKQISLFKNGIQGLTIQPVLYYTGTFHLGTILIWTLFLLVNSVLHSPDSDYLLIVSKLKLGDGLDQMQLLLKRDAVLHVIHWKMSFILF